MYISCPSLIGTLLSLLHQHNCICNPTPRLIHLMHICVLVQPVCLRLWHGWVIWGCLLTVKWLLRIQLAKAGLNRQFQSYWLSSPNYQWIWTPFLITLYNKVQFVILVNELGMISKQNIDLHLCYQDVISLTNVTVNTHNLIVNCYMYMQCTLVHYFVFGLYHSREFILATCTLGVVKEPYLLWTFELN